MSARARTPAVFLDRDGTLTDEAEWVLGPDQVRLLPGAGPAIARLNRAGWPVILVTNQSAVARGWIDTARLAEIHARLAALLARDGARFDAVYHCPHHPTEGVGALRRACACRKPEPGMLLDAAADLHLDLERSWVVGDAERDLEAGRRAGARVILVRTGKGALEAERLARAGRPEALVVADLSAAAEHVLASAQRADQGK